MFNKEESNNKYKITMGKIDFQKVGNILLTSSLIMMLTIPMKAESQTTNCNPDANLYHKRLADYRVFREYDEKIKDYYNNYQIMIDGITYPIDKFYLSFNKNDDNPIFHLVNAQSEYTDILTNSMDKFEYNKLIKFRDATAFIALLDSDAVMIDGDNKIIIITDKIKALDIIHNWDGLIHDKVPETDAVIDKDMLRRK